MIKLNYLVLIGMSLCLAACGGNNNSGNSGSSEFTVGGTVTGLNGTLVLNNNAGNPVTINADGVFTFSGSVASGSAYAVTVASQPPGQTCTVSNGSGSDVVSNISTISVACAATTFTIGGSVTGLAASESVVLQNNAGDAQTISADGSFTFTTQVAYGGGYSVTVSTQPVGATCAVSKASASSVTSDVNTVVVTCSNSSESVVWSFGAGTDGMLPNTAPILAGDGNYYGTLLDGGANFDGAVYKITPSGVESIVYNFTGASDGEFPFGGLTLGSDGNFYGTTTSGGTNGSGTIYKITPGGTLTVLYNFGDVSNDGRIVRTPMIEGSDGNFYGVASAGGISSNGTVFKVTPTGTYTLLYKFASGTDASSPLASLVEGSDGNFYGTTEGGGSHGDGAVFKITPAGVESVLWSFGGTGDGIYGNSNLVIGADGNFYGTCSAGGTNNDGVFFKVTPGGIETVLHSFGGGTDTQQPYGNLVLAADGNFYGASLAGGTYSQGTIFKVTPTGTESLLWSFGGSGDGQQPFGGLIIGADGHFYGTANSGGTNSAGIFFRY